MSRFFIVRHGETMWNKEFKYQGQSDVPLNDTGRFQARKLSERLKKEKIDVIYSSDLQRAMETAEIIARPHCLGVQPVKEMRELCFGIWEGLTFNEIERKWPDELEKWRRDPFHTKPPGGENLSELLFRTSNFIKKIARNHVDKRILIVTHAGPVRALLASILNLKDDFFWKFKISNASLTVIEYDGMADLNESNAFIITVNETYHLYDKTGP
ncbi:alpha-ribazole phosphatase [Thermoanaerobacterium sp. DL9XJH110]|uniref:alpha-ribazole phosphatase n=1 Tax=Thermoanaerobacterium sp. DL9XJH110 TaxID=3386643 RepID=UPI003BB4F616